MPPPAPSAAPSRSPVTSHDASGPARRSRAVLRTAAVLAVAALSLVGGGVPGGVPEGPESPTGASARPRRAFAGDPPDGYDRVLEEHRKRLKTDDVDRAVGAVKVLDPANPRSLPAYFEILAKWHWRVRGAAVEALATVPAGPLRAELRLHLVTHEDPFVREGIAAAMTIGPVPGDAEALVGAMDDPEWRVRRAAARGLGEIVSRAGVERLVRAVGAETDLRVAVWVRASLRGIVREDFGRDAVLWQAWWDVHKDRPEWVRQGDEAKREDFAGVPFERITVDRSVRTDEERKARASRPELVVLAPFGWSHGWFRPYLDDASDFVKVVYVTLPSVREVTGASGYGTSIPVYPVEKLSKALEEMRKRDGRDRLLLLAAGPVAWIAERYALDHPDRVAGLVLVDGWLDTQAYVEALTRLATEGRPLERRAARTLMGEGRRDEAESEDLRTAFLTSSLTDLRDLEAFRLWRECRRDHGFATVPALKFDRKVRISTPTLFTFPDPAVQPFSGGTPADLQRIRQSFKDPNPILAVLRDERGLAHVNAPEEFLRVLRGFLDYSGVRR